MLQGEHSAILSTFIKLPFVNRILGLSIFEWPLKTCLTVDYEQFISVPSVIFELSNYCLLHYFYDRSKMMLCTKLGSVSNNINEPATLMLHLRFIAASQEVQMKK